jgi:SAM-dependent methyltransferase
MLRLRHFFHPVRSAKGLYRRGEVSVYRWLGEREVANIPRQTIERCWCGGSLQALACSVRYGSCVECGCCVNLHPPTPESLKDLYTLNGYWRLRQRMYGIPPIEKRAEFYRADGRIEYWKKLIGQFGPPSGKVLEVGCAPGTLLADLTKLGYSCIGLEPNNSVADWIRQNSYVKVEVGLFPNVKVSLCDLFLAFDVAEHTPVPVAFWSSIRTVLNPGGIAIVQTPIEFRDYSDPFRSRRDLLDGLEHLYLYTEKSVLKLVELSGLELIAIGDAMGGYLTQFCVLRMPVPSKNYRTSQ